MRTMLAKLAGFGFLLGMLVGAFIVIAESFAVGGGSLVLPDVLLAATGTEAGALLAHMLVSGAYGAIPMAGVVFYQVESWGLLKQAVIHYATYMVAYIAIGTDAGWFEPSFAVLGPMAGIFAVGHAIIWLIMYLRYKAEAAQLSALVQEAKQSA